LPATLSPRLPLSLAFLAAWLLVPLAAYFLVLQQRPSFEPRYLMLVTPALFLLLGLPPALARTPGQQRVLAGLAALPLVAMLAGLSSYFTDETYFKDDSAGVAAWLAAETTANDIVYIDVPHPFHYYAKRMNIPAPTRYLFVDIHTAADILNREAAGRDRLFWVTWWGSDTDPRGVIPFLGEKYGQQLGRREFRGYRVDWYSLPPAGTVIRLPVDPPPVEAVFGDVFRLDGAAFGGAPAEATTLPRGESAWAVLHFTLLRDTEVNYRVSLRLRGEDGRLVSQVDKDLLNDRHFRTAAWPLDDPALNQALNVYLLPVPPDAPPGDYRLEAVLYSAEPPYPSEGVFGPYAAPDAASAVLGKLTILP
ncbi:MAG: hypothetical protein D6784_03310, partial [Chloroflexi bacterium]